MEALVEFFWKEETHSCQFSAHFLLSLSLSQFFLSLFLNFSSLSLFLNFSSLSLFLFYKNKREESEKMAGIQIPGKVLSYKTRKLDQFLILISWLVDITIELIRIRTFFLLERTFIPRMNS